jgi:O-antigen/teichoic acid export membrane protein
MLRRVSALFSVRLAAAALQALVLVYLARVLGPDEFGGFAAALALGTVLSTALGFGLRTQALRVLGIPQREAYTATMTLLRAATAVLAGMAVAAVSVPLFGIDEKLAFVAAVYGATEAFALYSQNVLLGVRDGRRATVSVLVKPAAPLAAIGLALLFRLDVVWALGAGTLVAAGACWLLLRRHMAGYAAVRRVLRQSIPYWASTSLVSLQQLDVTLVASFAPATLAGNFAGAQRVINPMNMATTSILSIVTPDLSADSNPAKRAGLFAAARRSVLIMGIGFTALAPVAAFLGPKVLGPAYSGSGPIFAALTVALMLNGLSQVYAGSFYAHARANLLTRVRLLTAPSSLALVAVAACMTNAWALAGAVVVGRLIELSALHLAHHRLTASE